MRDVATVLPLLKRLDDRANATGSVPNEMVVEACMEYEAEMIPRAFEWVQKSGGSTLCVWKAL